MTALRELHEARAATRFDRWGRLVLLADQDRRRWYRTMIMQAVARLRRVAGQARPGRYQLQAAIVAQHALAPTYGSTNWSSIRALYDQLALLDPSPLVRLSRAVATR